MFKVTFPKGHSENYSEVPQNNPLRWMMLKPGKKKNEFIQDSYWLKCKDFFNDYVYARQKCGEPFQIYGFDTTNMHLGKPDEPVYCLLKKFGSAFLANMEVVNKWLKEEQKLPPVKLLQEEEYILAEFPPVYWENTYNVSLISLLMRVVSCNKEFKTFDEIAKFSPFGESHLWPPVVKKGLFFNIPDKFKGYVWYQNQKQNSEKIKSGYDISYLIHDNGVISWSNNFDKK